MSQEAVTGELDFYFAGDLDWAIELLRNGKNINEHAKRFEPTLGKYRKVGHKDRLVVDCRGSLVKAVEPVTCRRLCDSTM